MNDLDNFSRVWPGGYYEGDPQDPFGTSSYMALGYVSVLYATYLVCIKPYVGPNSVVLEIGPGRGAWTKTFVDLGARKIVALDAAPAEYTGFHDYVGRHHNVEYHQVRDSSLREVADESIDFFFSFGVFCHLPEPMIAEYLERLPRKMKSGAHGFFLVADFDRFNATAKSAGAVERLFRLRRFMPQRIVHGAMTTLFKSRMGLGSIRDDARWFDLGQARACQLAEKAGLRVVEGDVGTCPRDPIIHVVKP